MKLYKISQDRNDDDDTYDSAIVVAENEEQARLTNPMEGRVWSDNQWNYKTPSGLLGPTYDYSWTAPEFVKVEYLGEAQSGLKQGVVLASYNAG